MSKFDELIIEQIKYGAKKYAVDGKRESTDILTERYGLNGLLWTIEKYVYRFENQQREKDPLKIGAYAYILWLKFGFNKNSKRFETLQDTTIETKEYYFPSFIKVLNKTFDNFPAKLLPDNLTNELHQVIPYLTYTTHQTEETVLGLYFLASKLFEKHGFTGENTDTGDKNASH